MRMYQLGLIIIQRFDSPFERCRFVFQEVRSPFRDGDVPETCLVYIGEEGDAYGPGVSLGLAEGEEDFLERGREEGGRDGGVGVEFFGPQVVEVWEFRHAEPEEGGWEVGCDSSSVSVP